MLTAVVKGVEGELNTTSFGRVVITGFLLRRIRIDCTMQMISIELQIAVLSIKSTI